MKILKRGLTPEEIQGLAGGFVGEQPERAFRVNPSCYAAGWWVYDNETGEKVACYSSKRGAEIADAHYHNPETRGEILNYVHWKVPGGNSCANRWAVNPDGSPIYAQKPGDFGFERVIKK